MLKIEINKTPKKLIHMEHVFEKHYYLYGENQKSVNINIQGHYSGSYTTSSTACLLIDRAGCTTFLGGNLILLAPAVIDSWFLGWTLIRITRLDYHR